MNLQDVPRASRAPRAPVRPPAEPALDPAVVEWLLARFPEPSGGPDVSEAALRFAMGKRAAALFVAETYRRQTESTKEPK